MITAFSLTLRPIDSIILSQSVNKIAIRTWEGKIIPTKKETAKFSMITEILLEITHQRKNGKIVTDALIAEVFDEFYSPIDVLAALELADALGLVEHEGEGGASIIKADDDGLRKCLEFIKEWEGVRKTVADN